MKLSLLTVAALAAFASAIPIRIITFTGSPFDNLSTLDALASNEIAVSEPRARGPAKPRPCHKAKSTTSSYLPGPISDLFSRFGLSTARSKHGDHWTTISDAVKEHQYSPHVKAEENGFDAWQAQIEGSIREAEDEVIPLLEGGHIRILPMASDGNAAEKSEHHGHYQQHETNGEWQALEGKGGIKKHHHRVHAHKGEHERRHHSHGHSFCARLRHAFNHLSPAEALTFAFVMGTGIGSILHTVFMIVLLSLRRVRCGKADRTARRAARREARRARKIAKHEGSVRLEGEDVLPVYVSVEGDKVIIEEKA